MNLSDDVDLEDYVARPDKISGADINAICQEAGMHAVRENRLVFALILFNLLILYFEFEFTNSRALKFDRAQSLFVYVKSLSRL